MANKHDLLVDIISEMLIEETHGGIPLLDDDQPDYIDAHWNEGKESLIKYIQEEL